MGPVKVGHESGSRVPEELFGKVGAQPRAQDLQPATSAWEVGAAPPNRGIPIRGRGTVY
jgi:hypothetical protein